MRESYLSILRSGNVYQSLGCRVYNIQKLQNCGSIIRNSGFACKIMSCKSQHENLVNMIPRNMPVLPNKTALLQKFRLTSVIYHKLVHATGAEGGPHSLCHNLAGIDVTDELWDPLRGVCALLQEDDWSGLRREV